MYDKPFWRFGTVPKRSPHNVLNLAGKPAVVFSNWDEDDEVMRVVRRTRFPATFELVEGDRKVGTVRRITPLRNRYRIELDAGTEWSELKLTFHMPLFTISFAGWSDCGKQLWVKVWRSKREWLVMREPELNHPYLLPALAFIHREWWCYS